MKFNRRVKIGLITMGGVLIVLLVGYAHLMKLKSKQTYFDELDEALKNPERVETLVMRNRGMKALPADIGKLRELKSLNIGNNHLTSLPAEIGQLENLEELIAENNLLTELPIELLDLTKLRRLNLSHNKLKLFPVVNAGSIEEIYLTDNFLLKVPKQIRKMRHLKIIDLAENEILKIPIDVSFPDSVRKIDLYNNGLRSVPVSIFSLRALQELILEENPLDEKTAERYQKFKTTMRQHDP